MKLAHPLLSILVGIMLLTACTGTSSPTTPTSLVDPETKDMMKFYMRQSMWDAWYETFDEQTLVLGLMEIHSDAVYESDDYYRSIALCVMGDTGLLEFVPILIDDIDLFPIEVSHALSNIQSNEGIQAVIGKLDSADSITRDSAASALGRYPYYADSPGNRNGALYALRGRLAFETESWVLETVERAIARIESGNFIM